MYVYLQLKRKKKVLTMVETTVNGPTAVSPRSMKDPGGPVDDCPGDPLRSVADFLEGESVFQSLHLL